MFNWFKKKKPIHSTEIVNCIFKELTFKYNKKFTNLRYNVIDHPGIAAYEIRILWTRNTENMCLPITIVYEDITNDNAMHYINETITNKLDKEIKVLEYNNDFDELLK